MEKVLKPISGYTAAIIALLSLILGISTIVNSNADGSQIVLGLLCIVVTIFIFKGLMAVEPNNGIVLTFFGKFFCRASQGAT